MNVWTVLPGSSWLTVVRYKDVASVQFQSTSKLRSVLTLFNALYRSDQVVEEVLAVGQGIRDARGFVYGRQGRVEDGDDIL